VHGAVSERRWHALVRNRRPGVRCRAAFRVELRCLVMREASCVYGLRASVHSFDCRTC
jgi:hypothetical protein